MTIAIILLLMCVLHRKWSESVVGREGVNCSQYFLFILMFYTYIKICLISYLPPLKKEHAPTFKLLPSLSWE